jgi:hypothetical protein
MIRRKFEMFFEGLIMLRSKRLLSESREQIVRGESLTAEEVFLESNQIDPLTEAINQVADQVDTRLEPGLKRLRDATLERH